MFSTPKHDKYTFIRNILRDNHLSVEQKIDIFSIFNLAQKTYFALVRFVKVFRHKRTVQYNSIDLLMSPIDRGSINIVEIYQERRIYLFTLNDIVHLFNRNLSHSPYFFSEPIPLKNPYNNILFTKADLYNIYFFVRSSNCATPQLMQLFFESNFDILRFQRENQYIIRDFYIKNHVATMSKDVLLGSIYTMIREYSKIKIHHDFPSSRIIEVFKPYLYMYFQWAYSLSTIVQKQSMDHLYSQLHHFHKYNPRFGRKMIRVKKVFELNRPFGKFKGEIYFNDVHLPFNIADVNFMKNHVQFTEYMDYMNVEYDVGDASEGSLISEESDDNSLFYDSGGDSDHE